MADLNNFQFKQRSSSEEIGRSKTIGMHPLKTIWEENLGKVIPEEVL